MSVSFNLVELGSARCKSNDFVVLYLYLFEYRIPSLEKELPCTFLTFRSFFLHGSFSIFYTQARIENTLPYQSSDAQL